MTDRERLLFPGSERAALAGAEPVAEVLASERVQVTLVLRRRAELPEELVEGGARLGRQELAERYGADPAHIERVRGALVGSGLAIVSVDAGSRR